MSEQHPPIPSRPTASVGLLAEDLARRPNVCDQRKGRDLKLLLEAAQGVWQGRLSDLSIAGGSRQSWLLSGVLQVGGLAWEGEPVVRDEWQIQISIPRHYPIAQPEVRLESPVPYNTHVLHGEFLPDERQLPVQLRPYLEQIRAGHEGSICFLQQWRADLWYDLRLVVWQVGRILCGACFHGEANSLNNHARDYYLRLKAQGGLPIAAALPIYADEMEAVDAGHVGPFEFFEGDPGNDTDVLWSIEEGE